jgi:hypothetical protein
MYDTNRRQNFGIRFARPDEARELIGLLTRQHGLLYPQQDFYSVDFIADSIAKKHLAFAVATTESGEFAGMICSEAPEPPDNVMVFSLLTVIPEYRNQRLGNLMQNFLDENLPLAQCAFTCMYCLTVDTVSQRGVQKRGYTPTGLLPNRYFFDKSAVNLMDREPPMKRTHLLMCKAFAHREAGTLFCPGELEYFTKEVYGALGVAVTFADSRDTPSELPSAFRVHHNDSHAYCEIMIDSAGSDLEELLRDCARRYDGSPFQTYSVMLNMSHASCPFAYRILRGQGYICTGLSPLAAAGAHILLCRSSSFTRDYGSYALLPSFRAAFEQRLQPPAPASGITA